MKLDKYLMIIVKNYIALDIVVCYIDNRWYARNVY